MRVGIDLQHNGKPDKRDLGFVDPFAKGKNEYWWIAQYGVGIQLRLNELGHTTFLNGMGAYSERADRFNHLDVDLVVLCHVNMMPMASRGKGRTGKIFLDHRTSQENITAANKACEYLSSLLPWEHAVQLSRPDDWTKNAFYVQKGYGAYTWVLEPFFGDNLGQVGYISTMKHAGYDGPVALGAMIADAINKAV